MKINKHRKLACTLIATASLLSLVSCGDNNASEKQNNTKTTDGTSSRLSDDRPQPAEIFNKLKNKNFTLINIYNVIGAKEKVDEKKHSYSAPSSNSGTIFTMYTERGFVHSYNNGFSDLYNRENGVNGGYVALNDENPDGKKGVYNYNVKSVDNNEVITLGNKVSDASSVYESMYTPYDLYLNKEEYSKNFKQRKYLSSEVNRITNEDDEGAKYLVELQKAFGIKGLLDQVKGINVVCCDLKYSASSKLYEFTFYYSYSSVNTNVKYSVDEYNKGLYQRAVVSKLTSIDKTSEKTLNSYIESISKPQEPAKEEKGEN